MILFIDDETRRMDSYVQELILSKFDVTFKQDVDEALAFFEEYYKQINLIILDIMMPPGETFKDVDVGLRTGVYFYEKIRPVAPNLPVIIFTNVPVEKLGNRFLSEKNCWVLRKKDCLPFEMVQQIKQILS